MTTDTFSMENMWTWMLHQLTSEETQCMRSRFEKRVSLGTICSGTDAPVAVLSSLGKAPGGMAACCYVHG